MYSHVDIENGSYIFSFHRTRTLYDVYFLTDTLRNNMWLNYGENFLKSQYLFPILSSPHPFPASKKKKTKKAQEVLISLISWSDRLSKLFVNIVCQKTTVFLLALTFRCGEGREN